MELLHGPRCWVAKSDGTPNSGPPKATIPLDRVFLLFFFLGGISCGPSGGPGDKKKERAGVLATMTFAELWERFRVGQKRTPKNGGST